MNRLYRCDCERDWRGRWEVEKVRKALGWESSFAVTRSSGEEG